MVTRMALLRELGWSKLEERRKEKKMMYGKRFGRDQFGEGGKLLINRRITAELVGGDNIMRKSTARVERGLESSWVEENETKVYAEVKLEAEYD